MSDNRRFRLARTIFTQYRDNFGLFWRIMIPVAIVAIALNVVIFNYNVTRFEKSSSETFSANSYTIVSSISTIGGVYPELSLLGEKAPLDTSTPNVSWQLLPVPYFNASCHLFIDLALGRSAVA